jgi:hypothetical protein
MFLFLVTGHAAKYMDRRKLLDHCHMEFAACSGLLRGNHLWGSRLAYPVYAVLVLVGVGTVLV